MARTVIIQVRNVGQNFAHCGVIRDARSRKKLAKTTDVPFGMRANAYQAAVALAQSKGWQIADEDDQ